MRRSWRETRPRLGFVVAAYAVHDGVAAPEVHLVPVVQCPLPRVRDVDRGAGVWLVAEPVEAFECLVSSARQVKQDAFEQVAPRGLRERASVLLRHFLIVDRSRDPVAD